MDTHSTKARLAWSLAEIAESTGLSVAFLRAEVRAGHLVVRRFGRRLLVTDRDLCLYLESGSVGNKFGEMSPASKVV